VFFVDKLVVSLVKVDQRETKQKDRINDDKKGPGAELPMIWFRYRVR
jgi:hypothetical protein